MSSWIGCACRFLRSCAGCNLAACALASDDDGDGGVKWGTVVKGRGVWVAANLLDAIHDGECCLVVISGIEARLECCKSKKRMTGMREEFGDEVVECLVGWLWGEKGRSGRLINGLIDTVCSAGRKGGGAGRVVPIPLLACHQHPYHP